MRPLGDPKAHSLEEPPSLSALERGLMGRIAAQLPENSGVEEALETLPQQLAETIPMLAEVFVASFRQTAPTRLQEWRADTEAFERRLFERWRVAFDHLETLCAVVEELGDMNNQELAVGDDGRDYVVAALSNLFPKALLTTREIISLLRSGYPDGALARWRSLHEVNVTMMYLKKHGADVALAYLLSFRFASRRAAKQLAACADRARIAPPTQDELAELDRLCDEAQQRLGRSIDKDKYGEWPAINTRHKDFSSIERDVGLEHWRPRYKWASTYIHGGHMPHERVLGASEARSAGYLVGPSNGGFVDPLQMTAISIAQATLTYLDCKPNVDRAVYAHAVQQLLDEMLSLPRAGESPRGKPCAG